MPSLTADLTANAKVAHERFREELSLSEISGSFGDLGTFLPLLVCAGPIPTCNLSLIVASQLDCPQGQEYLVEFLFGAEASPAASCFYDSLYRLEASVFKMSNTDRAYMYSSLKLVSAYVMTDAICHHRWGWSELAIWTWELP